MVSSKKPYGKKNMAQHVAAAVLGEHDAYLAPEDLEAYLTNIMRFPGYHGWKAVYKSTYGRGEARVSPCGNAIKTRVTHKTGMAHVIYVKRQNDKQILA